MPINRTPPSAHQLQGALALDECPSRTQSDSNIPLLVDDEKSRKAPKRTKRQRPKSPLEHSCEEVKDEFNEMKELLLSFKKEQTTILSTLAKDVNDIKSSKNEHSEILNKLMSDMNEVKQQNSQIQKTNKDLGESIAMMSINYEAMNSKIENLQKEKDDCVLQIQHLQNSVQDITRLSRPSTVEIKNIPHEKDESTESMRAAIIKLGRVLKVDIQSSDIRDVYRYPGKPGSTRSIISEFSSVSLKKSFLSAAKAFNKLRSTNDKLNTGHLNYKDKMSPIYVVEYLPGSARKLFFLAREFSRTNNYKFCWTKDGRIFVQKDDNSKAMPVHSELTLKEFSGPA